jgi:hypothetical protein
MGNPTGKGGWKPGQSGNPSGRGGFQPGVSGNPGGPKEIRALAQQHSAEAIQVLVKLSTFGCLKLNELAPARFLLRAGFGSDATRHDLSPRRCERQTGLVSRGPIFSTIPQAFRGELTTPKDVPCRIAPVKASQR